MQIATASLRVTVTDGSWTVTGSPSERLRLVNDYLGYLADRHYSPRTVRSYAFDLLHFSRWTIEEKLPLEAVATDHLLRYIAACRATTLPGRPSGNVVSIADGRAVAGYAATTINRRLAAISGLYAYRCMRDPEAGNPVPRRRDARHLGQGKSNGLLGHLSRAKPGSQLRLREPRRLPRGLDTAEIRALLGSFRNTRDRGIAGLMLFSELRSAEVLGLDVRDVDIARGWVRVIGKGNKERRVPIDPEVAGVLQSYLLAERPESETTALFLVAKGPHRGQPLTPAGLRTVFRYHRQRANVPAGHPHALRHSFGTALAESGVDLSVLQALMGHDHVDSASAYIHLAPRHLRAAYDDARIRQRAGL